MELLMAYSSPLYGRMTGQWRVQPLPFGALRAFLPGWPAEQQVAVYAMVGGVSAYLSWFRADRSLLENVRDTMLAPGSLAHDEALTLLADELREPRAYLAILSAIGAGCHTFGTIKEATLLGDVHLPAYLSTLQELRFVERRLPVTIPSAKQRLSRQGRYHLSDPFLRFYFRFLHPHRAILGSAPERILPILERDLPTFVAQTAWPELARQWVRVHGHAGGLPFVPEVIGSHWSRNVQAPVVAFSWTELAILIGECTWGDAAVDRQAVRDLLNRIVPLTVADLPDKGVGWQVYPAFFARAGATPAARKTLAEAGGMVVDLPTLFADLAEG
jgi:AAA+ ATPase superfamily predicted ATPase